MKSRNFNAAILALIFAATLATSRTAKAEIGMMTDYVPPTHWSLGAETELQLTEGAGMGLNTKASYGMNEFVNVGGLVGFSGGGRKFRLGGYLVTDIFPDVEGQPGMGITTAATYIKTSAGGLLQMQLIPYIKKTFKDGNSELTPFISVPFGFRFKDGMYTPESNLAFGTLVRASERVKWLLEMGIAINNSQTYASGGVVFYP